MSKKKKEITEEEVIEDMCKFCDNTNTESKLWRLWNHESNMVVWICEDCLGKTISLKSIEEDEDEQSIEELKEERDEVLFDDDSSDNTIPDEQIPVNDIEVLMGGI